MTIKKVKYIGHVVKDEGHWHSRERVKFSQSEYENGFKSKRVGSDWSILHKENVIFVAKETTTISKDVVEELI